MKLKRKMMVFAILMLIANVKGQISPYFQTLQTTKVSSVGNVAWKQFGPGMAGYCEFFWCHPTDANSMFMAPDMFNAYGTSDAGKSWKSILDSDGPGGDMGRTYDIEFSRTTPTLGFAIDELGGLFKTTDKGKTWVKQTKSLVKAHSEIAVDPTNDNIWYIGSGSWWDVKRTHRTNIDNITEMRPTAIRGQIYKTTNKGGAWTLITGHGLPATLDVIRIIVNPKDPKNIIMAANTGIYISTDSGANWTLGNAKLPKDMTSFYNSTTKVFTLYMIEQTRYAKSGTTYTSTGGIFKSTDGKTWTAITGDLNLDMTKISSAMTKTFFKKTIANWLGIATTSVGDVYPTSILPTFNRIVINPTNAQEIYISQNVKHDYSFGPGDVWKTDNGGTNWYPCARSGTYWINNTDAAYWASRVKKVSGTNTKFAHLQDEINNEEELYGCRLLSMSPNGNVFISLDQQVLKSSDKGTSWNYIDDNETAAGTKNWVGNGDSNMPGRFMLLETGVPYRKFFCAGEHGLWQNAPLGTYADQTAFAVKQIEGQVNHGGSTSIANIAVHPGRPDTLYTLQFRQDHRDEIRWSKDAGKTWATLGTPIVWPDNLASSEHMKSYSLIIDPVNTKNMYFTLMRFSPREVNDGTTIPGFNDYGVYKSADGGKNWSLKNNGLPTAASIHRLAMHPNNSNTLFAAVVNYSGVLGGLYRTTDKGENWSKVTSFPAAVKSVNDVYFDPTTKDIYVSCGLYASPSAEGGVWCSKDNAATWTKVFDLPYVWQTVTSSKDPNIIMVCVPRHVTCPNPGIYVSRNGGTTWDKENSNVANFDKITDIKTDPDNKNVYWCAGWGSGWYKGAYTAPKAAVKKQANVPVESIEESTLGIYPNPSKDGVIYVNGFENGSTYKIIDLKGLIIENGYLLNGIISAPKLISGLYIVELKSGDKLKTYKLQISK